MRERERISRQLRQALEGGVWPGPSVFGALDGVDAELAAARPIAETPSIWELVLQLRSSYALARSRLHGDAATVNPEHDWPDLPTPTAAEWVEAVRALLVAQEALLAELRVLPDVALDEPVAPEFPYSRAEVLYGVAQQDSYHAGQIMLLRRAAHGARLRRVVCRAITARRLLMFGYRDRVRMVEPHVFGVNTAGHEALSAWMRAGFSRSQPAGGWRMFLARELRDLQALDETFAAPRPGYNPDDPHFPIVYCRLRPGGEV